MQKQLLWGYTADKCTGKLIKNQNHVDTGILFQKYTTNKEKIVACNVHEDAVKGVRTV